MALMKRVLWLFVPSYGSTIFELGINQGLADLLLYFSRNGDTTALLD